MKNYDIIRTYKLASKYYKCVYAENKDDSLIAKIFGSIKSTFFDKPIIDFFTLKELLKDVLMNPSKYDGKVLEILAEIGYIASPVDVVPDAIPVLGLIDDSIAFYKLYNDLVSFIPDDIKMKGEQEAREYIRNSSSLIKSIFTSENEKKWHCVHRGQIWYVAYISDNDKLNLSNKGFKISDESFGSLKEAKAFGESSLNKIYKGKLSDY